MGRGTRDKVMQPTVRKPVGSVRNRAMVTRSGPPLPSPVHESALSRIVDAIAPYKELGAILVAVVAGSVAVLQYFATKGELKIVKCEAQHRVDQTRAELDMLNADRSVERSQSILKALAQSNAGAQAIDTVTREMEIQKKQYETALAAKRDAETQLAGCRDEEKSK
jgi:hypothetical protein